MAVNCTIVHTPITTSSHWTLINIPVSHYSGHWLLISLALY